MAKDDRDPRVVVALDVGGTSIKTGLVGPCVCTFGVVPTERHRGPDAVIATIGRTCRELAAMADGRGFDVIATSVAVPGIVDRRRGIAESSVNLGWRDVPLREILGPSATGRLSIQHDVRAAARAEAAFGAAAATGLSVFVAVGTGVAAAFVDHENVLDGATNRAGEIGLTRLDASTTLEDVASARGIVEAYSRVAGRRLDPSGFASTVDLPRIIDLAARGDVQAATVWNHAIAALADVLTGIVVAVDPARVVIGGGVANAGAAFTGPLAAAIDDRLSWRSAPPVVAARFDARAGVVGSALTAWQSLGHPNGTIRDAVLSAFPAE